MIFFSCIQLAPGYNAHPVFNGSLKKKRFHLSSNSWGAEPASESAFPPDVGWALQTSCVPVLTLCYVQGCAAGPVQSNRFRAVQPKSLPSLGLPVTPEPVCSCRPNMKGFYLACGSETRMGGWTMQTRSVATSQVGLGASALVTDQSCMVA